MSATRFPTLGEWLGDEAPAALAGLRVGGIELDSRQLRTGDAFVALGGAHAHGLSFAPMASARGAAVILADPEDSAHRVTDATPHADSSTAPIVWIAHLQERLGALAARFHAEPSRALTTIGVTGTSGKTSMVQLVAQALTLAGTPAGTIGTLGAGLYGHEQATGFTTPQSPQTHAWLARLRDAGARAVAMEVSSHALDQGRVDGVHFDVAVFTNLSRDHLDYHGDMQRYAETKAKLFRWPQLESAVLNLDDPVGQEIAGSLAADVRRITASSRGLERADVRAHDLMLDARGLAFTLHLAGESFAIRSPLLGRFNVDNLLLVAAVLHARGFAPVAIAELLAQLTPVPGRMNRLGGDGRRPLVVVDYSHKPDPLEQALASLRGHLRGELTCVFGCGGERDRGKRPQMAAIAERGADRVIVTDDNPRHENGDAIVADIVAGFAHPEAVHVERDRRRAIQAAIAPAGADDIVLIAGKGHETYQEVAGVKQPFDDRRIAREALEAHA